MTSDPLGLPGYADAVPVATGGTSTVWRAREVAFDRLVAVKVIAFPILDEDVRRRFVRELAMAGRLSGHPGVLTVHASGFTGDGRPYLTSEWCPAGSLADVLAESGPLAEAQVAAVGVAVAEALQAAHDLGVVHRDVKPQNVFVTAYGRSALADFGIAVATAEVTSPTDSLTPAHAAPEVLQGGTGGAAADVWGLGSTLWTLLTGSPPFAAGDGEGVLPRMLRILNDPLPSGPVSPVAQVLRELLAKDPSLRPTAQEVVERLRPLAEGASPLPQASTPGTAAVEPTRNRAALPGAVTASTAAAAPGVFSLLPPSTPSPDETVHRPQRPEVVSAQPQRRRRVLPLVLAAGAVVAAVAGTAWTLADREPEARPLAVGPAAATAATLSATPTAPVSPPAPVATLSGPAAPVAAPVDPAPAAAGPDEAEPAPQPVAQQPRSAPSPAAASPRPAAVSRPPSPAAAPQPNRIPVYRCDRGSEDLLYSTNPSCKPGYTQIRQAWSVTKDTGVPATTPLWRLRNLSTGVHLLTWSGDERSRLLGAGWDADGQVGWVRTTDASGWTRIWRLHDGTRYAYTNDASLQIWKDRGFRVEGTFWS